MNRVVVTRSFVGVYHMQVCAINDASEEEILEVCNRENPSGTSMGWVHICRDVEHRMLPIACQSDPNRTHYLVVC